MSEEIEESQVDEAPVAQEVSESQGEAAPESMGEQSVAQEPATPATAWDAFKGLEEFSGQDDRAIATSLYSALQAKQESQKAIEQYRQMQPYAQEYLQNKQAFDSWRNGQAQQQQQIPQQQAAPEPEQPRWWNPPELRESYKQYLVKDENGREVIHPDAPLEAKHSLYEFQKYKADFAQKFLANPEEALGPMVDEVASKRAEALVQEHMSTYQQEQWVSGLEAENKDWLYDQQGQPTEEGLAAKQYIEQLSQMGIQDHEQKWDLTQKLVERDLMEKILEKNKAQQAQQQFAGNLPQPQGIVGKNQPEEDMNYLRREASRSPSRAAPARAGSSQGPLSFEQRLAKAMRVSPQDE